MSRADCGRLSSDRERILEECEKVLKELQSLQVNYEALVAESEIGSWGLSKCQKTHARNSEKRSRPLEAIEHQNGGTHGSFKRRDRNGTSGLQSGSFCCLTMTE